MCDFPSWIQDGKNVYFLTDKEVNRRMRERPGTQIYDHLGHSAIESELGVFGGNYERLEDIPVKFAKAIQAGKCNKMMKAGGFKALHFNSKGQLHRIDGPAVMYNHASDNEWHINGEKIYPSDMRYILKVIKITGAKATEKIIVALKEFLV